MNAILRYTLALATVLVATQAAAQVTFHENQDFRGRTFTAQEDVANFQRVGFNDSASSVEVVGHRWEVCQNTRFRGRCVVLRPGRYPSLAAFQFDNSISSARVISDSEDVADNRYAPIPAAAAQVTFFENENFQGRSFTSDGPIINFDRYGFNDRASSVEVIGARWEVCEDTRFSGRCVVLRPGRYASLAAMGLNNRASSVRVASAAGGEAPAPVAAQATFYENESFQGRSFTTAQPIANFERFGFNDRASSIEVVGERWEVCEDTRFSGRCVVLRPGRYASLAAMGLNNRVSSVRAISRDARVDDNRYGPAPVAAVAAGQVTFYEQQGFGGRSFVTQQQIGNFERFGFNDRASSVEVIGERWEVCEDAQYSGRCVVLRPGRYPSLAAMGLNNRVSSVRIVSGNDRIDERRYGPATGAIGDYRRRNNERTFEANVTSVRAVVGTPEQRCWIEQEAVPQQQSSINVPGAVIGGLIGGILGHQVGGGSGKDIATVGGAVAGAAVGANVGRTGTQVATRDVQRCNTVQNQAAPSYWDVTYNFRGQEHRVQMSAPPGPTITVNEQGEPRT